MEKSYKMVLLLAMLQRGVDQWREAVTPVETATFFHGHYVEDEYRRRADWSDEGHMGSWSMMSGRR